MTNEVVLSALQEGRVIEDIRIIVENLKYPDQFLDFLGVVGRTCLLDFLKDDAGNISDAKMQDVPKFIALATLVLLFGTNKSIFKKTIGGANVEVFMAQHGIAKNMTANSGPKTLGRLLVAFGPFVASALYRLCSGIDPLDPPNGIKKLRFDHPHWWVQFQGVACLCQQQEALAKANYHLSRYKAGLINRGVVPRSFRTFYPVVAGARAWFVEALGLARVEEIEAGIQLGADGAAHYSALAPINVNVGVRDGDGNLVENPICEDPAPVIGP